MLSSHASYHQASLNELLDTVGRRPLEEGILGLVATGRSSRRHGSDSTQSLDGRVDGAPASASGGGGGGVDGDAAGGDAGGGAGGGGGTDDAGAPTAGPRIALLDGAVCAWSRYRHFSAQRVLGRGAYGRAVLLCGPDGERVVAKQFWVAGMNARTLGRVEREIHLLASVRHPHIITYHCSFAHDDLLSIITEHAAGTLEQVLRAHRDASRPIGERQVVTWTAQLASALNAVHSKGILHRDIKPENILLTSDAQIKLADFGLSRKVDLFATSMCGTPAYMAPEQVSRGPYSWPADYWSLGCVLFELFTLQRPFDADSLGELAIKISTAAYDDAALSAAPYPDALKQLASRTGLLHPRPEARADTSVMLPILMELGSEDTDYESEGDTDVSARVCDEGPPHDEPSQPLGAPPATHEPRPAGPACDPPPYSPLADVSDGEGSDVEGDTDGLLTKAESDAVMAALVAAANAAAQDAPARDQPSRLR
jgi:NIMA (never in mitosis gene a)-related kinase